MTSSYRFSGPFVVRFLGGAFVAIGLLVLLLVVLVVLLSLPAVTLTVGVVAAAVAVIVLGLLATKRAVVVRFDETGYRIRYVRGAGVREARWSDVEDVVAGEVSGVRCLVLRLRDGRTSTVPVGLLAAREADFTADLRQRLNDGHGYRPLPRRRG